MKTISLNDKSGADGGREFSVMNLIAWLALGAGVLLCLFNLSDFSDNNLGLMVGIGCLIASVQIYVIGTAVHLVQNSRRQQ